MTPDLYMKAYRVCADAGIDCPDPGLHPLLPDGTVGSHCWAIQAIRDAKDKRG